MPYEIKFIKLHIDFIQKDSIRRFEIQSRVKWSGRGPIPCARPGIGPEGKPETGQPSWPEERWCVMAVAGTASPRRSFRSRQSSPPHPFHPSPSLHRCHRPSPANTRSRAGGVQLAWLPALLLVTTFALATGVARGTVLYAPDPYPTIQSAVDAASSGDEVRVYPGTYSGDGNILVNPLGRAITIRSIAGPEVTTIDCQSAGSAFRLNSDETDQTRIEGFTIRNGLAQEGGGIYCGYASPVIRDCIFRDCRAVYGGGVQLNQSHARVEGCQFFDCRAEGGTYGGSAGGLSAENGGATIIDCHFEGCSAHGIPAYGSGKGGGMWAGSAQVVRCRFQGNTADFLGGGLDADYTCQIEECVFIGNRAGTGGGACLGVNVVATGCTFAANATAPRRGATRSTPAPRAVRPVSNAVAPIRLVFPATGSTPGRMSSRIRSSVTPGPAAASRGWGRTRWMARRHACRSKARAGRGSARSIKAAA